MKARPTFAITILAFMILLNAAKPSQATKITRGPDPGFVAEVSYTGIPELGGILEVTCRFSISQDAIGAVYLETRKNKYAERPSDPGLAWEVDRPDSVHIWADTSIEILGPTSWSGQIEPSQEYVFTTSVRLKTAYFSMVNFGAATRYGNQPLGRLAFLTDNLPIPIGYVTKTVVDSLGNYWHKHETVMDSSLEGFVLFDSTRAIPPDTSFDKTGKVLFIIHVVQSGNKVKLPGNPPQIQVNPAKNIPQKPTRKSSKDDSFGAIGNGFPYETVTSKLQRISSNEGQGTLYTVTGTYEYQHAVSSQFEPIPLATIGVCYKDFFGNWELQFTDGTGLDGGFDVVVDEADVLLLVLADNPIVSVFTTESHGLANGGVFTYSYQLGFSNPAQIDISIDTLFAQGVSTAVTKITNVTAPFHVAARIFEGGFDPLFIHTGEVLTEKTWVFWDSLNTANNIASNFGSFTVDGIPGLYINNKDNASPCVVCDMDEWDESVIMHEFSHYLAWVYASPSPHAWGPHDGMSRPSAIATPSDTSRPLDLVFNEALASLLGGVLRGTPAYTDSVSGWALTQRGILGDWERPLPDSPWRSTFGAWFSASDESMDYPGEMSEMGILAVLWDIFDAPNDGDFFIGPTKFGHNNDFNSGSSYVGFQAIWDVLKNWDPQPLNSAHNHPWNIYEFVVGWKALGYPADQTFLDKLASHGVPNFVEGDVNATGNFNIGDLTAMISLVFNGIPVFGPPAQGDINADCSVNIADITYMIARIFTGGPPLLVGCVEP